MSTNATHESIDRYFPTEHWLERYEDALESDEDLSSSGEGWGVGWDGAMIFEITNVPLEGRTVGDLPEELSDLVVEEVESYSREEIETLLETAPEDVRSNVEARDGDLEDRVVEEILETDLEESPDRLWPELRAELPEVVADLLEQLETHLGDDDTVYTWIDLHDGGCRGTDIIDGPDDREHGFVISGAYEDWKGLVTGDGDVINLIMSGEMEIEGDMQKLLQYAEAATDMVDTAGDIDSKFIL